MTPGPPCQKEISDKHLSVLALLIRAFKMLLFLYIVESSEGEVGGEGTMEGGTLSPVTPGSRTVPQSVDEHLLEITINGLQSWAQTFNLEYLCSTATK